MVELRAQEIVPPFLHYLLAVGKQEQDKQPRNKGPVIRDGVRPGPRLASRTITLRELESVQTDRETRVEGTGERELLFSSSHLSSSFSRILPLCVLFREQDDYAFTI